ncbi:Clp protease N-terminal domain-containing protein [Streptomyces sp. NBC_00829]|uniref:Clp protease N-terminal domain-containing protein n=1 Tax=Streptomyces sp. NBC_00829 TaxID=2903679 RepID=UPI003866DD95|nr:peptidase [Streptomyces sp. NBC_00829]
MFERFTKDARDVVTGSSEHAQRAGADAVTEEHLLLALLDQEGTRAAFAFASLGITDRRESVEASLADVRRRGGLTKADSDALAELGIDVLQIVSKVESVHGEGALAVSRGPKRWWAGQRRPFAVSAKDTLVRSLRIATGRGDRRIGGEHVLLALMGKAGVVADVMGEYGVTYGAVERAMFGRGGAVAG